MAAHVPDEQKKLPYGTPVFFPIILYLEQDAENLEITPLRFACHISINQSYHYFFRLRLPN